MNPKYIPSKPSSIILLVDYIIPGSTWASTSDLEKIEYNLHQISNQFKIKGLATAASVYGKTRLIAFGRFIALIRLKKDKSEALMTFIDFTYPGNHFDLPHILTDTFSASVSAQVCKYLQREFIEANDKMIILKPAA